MDAVMWGDLFRFFTFVTGAGALALALWIAVNYARAWRRIHRSGEGEAWRGLLPRHVAVIGLSYSILVVLILHEHTGNEEPLTWREPTDLIALTLGLWALRDMTKYQRYHRVRLPGQGEGKRHPPREH